MFDQIAERYDLMNRIISLGMDQRWRRALVTAMDCGSEDSGSEDCGSEDCGSEDCGSEDGGSEDGGSGARFLDVATGTADVALALASAYTDATLVGLDPSEGMLAIGREKVTAAGLADRIELIAGDAQRLPFADDRFSASCISFGIRNVPDRRKGLAEMTRVTRSGGRVVVLELGEPRSGLLAPFSRLYVHRVVPMIGGWLSGAKEYSYLQASIAAFPSPDEFVALMSEVGLIDVSVRAMPFDAAHLYMGTAR